MLSLVGIFFSLNSWAATAAFNVASYNLRQQNSRDSINGDVWSKRCEVMSKLIRFHEFNIFGTQEGFKNQLEDLKAKLSGFEYVGVARDDGKDSGEHSAIFYDTAMFELLDHGDFWLSETPDRPGLGWDAACVRICSWAEFCHKASGKRFRFFNLHLDHVGTLARVNSVKLVKKKIREFDTALPTFLTGDFNVDQTTEMYDVLVEDGSLGDSFEKAKFVYALNGTFNAYETSGFTTSRIDHIFVTPNVDVKKYGVLTDSYRTPELDSDSKDVGGDKPLDVVVRRYRNRVPSDHFPVMIKVELR